MVYRTGANAPLGVQAFNAASVDTVAKHAIGTKVRAFDDTLGVEGEFIYLPGVANLVAGDAVVYDLLPTAPSVTRLSNNAQNNTGRPVAVALVAIPAGSYGWYQIGGVAVVNVAAGSAAGAPYASATAGALTSAADAGDQIAGARLSSAIGTPAANQAYVTLDRPHMQTQIT